MGLAASQVHFLSLTSRKADCERALSAESMNKMALTREMTELAQEYNSKLRNKQVSFYADGQYNLINQMYLLGDIGSDIANYSYILNGSDMLKKCNSMVLSDYKGATILADSHAKAIQKVLGEDAMDQYGRGGTFDKTKIIDIIATLTGLDGPVLIGDKYYEGADIMKKVYHNEDFEASYTSNPENSLTGESDNDWKEVYYGKEIAEQYSKILDFYIPIFSAAAANGWTTEYNREMKLNDRYISDALVSGAFQLATVEDDGQYNENGSLTYFLTRGYIETNSDAAMREELTAWYNSEKACLSEKETYADLRIDELSTELEAIKAEMQSIQTFIDDAISSVFDWSGG